MGSRRPGYTKTEFHDPEDHDVEFFVPRKVTQDRSRIVAIVKQAEFDKKMVELTTRDGRDFLTLETAREFRDSLTEVIEYIEENT